MDISSVYLDCLIARTLNKDKINIHLSLLKAECCTPLTFPLQSNYYHPGFKLYMESVFDLEAHRTGPRNGYSRVTQAI